MPLQDAETWIETLHSDSPARGKTKGFDPEGLEEEPPQRAQKEDQATKVQDQSGQGPRWRIWDPANWKEHFELYLNIVQGGIANVPIAKPPTPSTGLKTKQHKQRQKKTH